jgi:4-amino-4-deoxy-L-arabinose transferase-like glycosyltransferase
MNWEIFGYIGTVLILVSFLIENVFKLRLVNTVGAIFWLVYGIGIMAKPTIVVNLAVIIIHGIWFFKQKKEPK